MGGLVAARTVLDGRIKPSALVLSSPALRSWEPAWRRRLAHGLARVAPRLPLRNGLKTGMLSHDAQVVVVYRDDPLCTGWVTPRLADFIFRVPACLLVAAGHRGDDDGKPAPQDAPPAATSTRNPPPVGRAFVGASAISSQARDASCVQRRGRRGHARHRAPCE